MTDLANRYGTPSAARRRLLVGLVTVVAAAALGWLAWAAIYQSTPEVQSGSLGFEITSDHLASGEFTVRRSSPDVQAQCFLRAISEDHATVGELTSVVDSGAETRRIRFQLRTERRATSVELLGCSAPGQPQRK